MMMPKEIHDLVHELEQIAEDKITQPAGVTRRSVMRAARIIKELYNNADESTMDRRTTG